MKKIVLKSVVLAALAALVVLGGCDLVSRDFDRSDGPVPDEGMGALILVLDGSEIPTKTLAPDPAVYGPMQIASYEISGTRTEGGTFGPVVVDPSTLSNGVYVKTDLTPGEWTITVVAFNDRPTRVGSGTTDPFPVMLNQISTATVRVLPDTGEGALSLTIQWPDGSVLDPRVDARLTRVDSGVIAVIGSDSLQSPRFSIDTTGDPDEATYYDDVLAGYYTLHLELFANAISSEDKVIGDVVSIRIVYGQLTEGLWDLTSTGGTAKVTITSDLQNPIGISFTVVDNLDGTFDVRAQLDPNSADLFDYAWYIDGAAAPDRQVVSSPDTYDTYPLDPGRTDLNLASGDHNLSVVVVAYKAGDLHSVNSATHPFSVQ